MGKVEQQFFPDSSRLEVLVDVWLPEGSSYERTDGEVRKLEAWLAKQPETLSYTSNIGAGSQRFVLTLDQIFPQSNVAQIIVIPKDLSSRNVLRERLEQAFRTEFTNVRGRAKLLPNGPPVNYPVQFRVEGPDAKVARGIADQVKAIVEKNEYTLGVNDNWNESIVSIKLNIDQDQARALGVTSKSIAQATATLGGGAPVATFRDGDKQIDIVMRLYGGDAKSGIGKSRKLDELAQLNVFTTTGRAVPLAQIAKPELVFEPGVMWRENRNYAITVNADIKGSIQAPTVTGQIDPLLEPIRKAIPTGYNITVAGAQEESSKGQASIAAGVPVMLFLTFTLLMLQLKSFSRSLLVFLTGPFGIIGAAGALLLFNRPFGFVALLGVIALMGMIQRNSVILIDQIEQHISEGDAPWKAIVDSAVRRARPIVLTAAAAILAMIPLTRSVFWGPMAVAIMGGLVVATFLTLLSLPAMYAAWFKVKVTD
jgi:multidrug efflux pump subunit AcrB